MNNKKLTVKPCSLIRSNLILSSARDRLMRETQSKLESVTINYESDAEREAIKNISRGSQEEGAHQSNLKDYQNFLSTE
jgi:hypothetical protein